MISEREGSFCLEDSMFLARWAHRLLLWAGVVVVFGAVFYMGAHGDFEWLMPGLQAYLENVFKPLIDRLPNFETIDRAARVIGAGGTAATAAFGVWKGLRYAEHSLPERLREFLCRTELRLLQDRSPLLRAIYEPGNRVYAQQSVFHVSALNRALGEIGFSKYAAADESLQQALHQIDEQIATSNAQRRSMEEQKVAAHILRGSIASARAEANGKSDAATDADREFAELEFKSALDIRPRDLDALELRGRQRELRGNLAGAIEDFEQLTSAANAAGSPVRIARGYRRQASVREREGTPAKLSESRRRLQDGLDAINSIGSLNQEALLEKARIHEAYGRLQIRRDRLYVARQQLTDAISCYKQISSEEARQRESEVTKVLRGLTGSPPVEAEAHVGVWRRVLDQVRGIPR
jgi:hypothetical protein